MSGEADVLHVVVAGEVGGAERMLVDLAKSTARRHAIALFTPSERLRSLFRDAGLDIEDRGAVREGPLDYLVRSLAPADVGWLEKVAARRRARILHLHTFASQVLGTRAARRVGARVVRTEHSTRVYEDPSCWPFSRWSLRRTDAAVCISRHVREVAASRAPWAARLFSIVGNGVDVARFSPPSEERTTSRRPSAIVHARARLVMLGRLEPRKGVDIALEALAKVPGVELDIVGDGDSRAPLDRLARELRVSDRVRFAGFAEDVRPAILRADAVLSSARAEGLGIALLEAMAMGRPVIALPTGGVPEIVKHGETGWLASGSSPAALARAIEDALAAPSELGRRGRAARDFVVDRFSLDAMRAGYERVYASLAS